MTGDAEALVKRVRSVSDLPVAVGFGISTAEQVRQVWRFAEAAVIGSAIVREIERLSGKGNLVKQLGEFARSLLCGKQISPNRRSRHASASPPEKKGHHEQYQKYKE